MKFFMHIFLATMLASSPSAAFDGTGFKVKPSTVLKGGAALKGVGFCLKHKLTCTAVAGGIAIGGAVAINKIERTKIKATLVKDIAEKYGLGLEACRIYEACNSIFDEFDDYRDGLEKVDAFFGSIGATQENSNDDRGCHRNLFILGKLAPTAAEHVVDAQASGRPRNLTYAGPVGKDQRRKAAMDAFAKQAKLSGFPTKEKGMEKDEYPFASMLEAGANSSVRLIPKIDNDMGGRMIRTQTAGLPVGCRVTVIAVPKGAS